MPVVDLPDDFLLAGVVLHVVLTLRVSVGGGLALGGALRVARPLSPVRSRRMDAHQHSGPAYPRAGPAIVYLIVGLPGAGKTTHAKELEISGPALRLTPDEWQIMMFGDQNPPSKRDLVEGKLVQVGMRAAELAPMSSSTSGSGKGRTISAPLDRWHYRCAQPGRLPAVPRHSG